MTVVYAYLHGETEQTMLLITVLLYLNEAFQKDCISYQNPQIRSFLVYLRYAKYVNKLCQ